MYPEGPSFKRSFRASISSGDKLGYSAICSSGRPRIRIRRAVEVMPSLRPKAMPLFRLVFASYSDIRISMVSSAVL